MKVESSETKEMDMSNKDVEMSDVVEVTNSNDYGMMKITDFYKLFDQQLVKINLNGDKQLIHQFPNVYIAKFVQTSENEGILIGGCRDSKKDYPLNQCYKIQIQQNGNVVTSNIKPMTHKRVGSAV